MFYSLAFRFSFFLYVLNAYASRATFTFHEEEAAAKIIFRKRLFAINYDAARKMDNGAHVFHNGGTRSRPTVDPYGVGCLFPVAFMLPK